MLVCLSVLVPVSFLLLQRVRGVFHENAGVFKWNPAQGVLPRHAKVFVVCLARLHSMSGSGTIGKRERERNVQGETSNDLLPWFLVARSHAGHSP